MTDQKDNDAILEQYLKGESEHSEQYKELPEFSPPEELDVAIMATAHNEVKKRKHPQWIVPLSVAATVVLSVSLVSLYAPLSFTDKEQDIILSEAAPSSPAIIAEKIDQRSLRIDLEKDKVQILRRRISRLKKKTRRVSAVAS